MKLLNSPCSFRCLEFIFSEIFPVNINGTTDLYVSYAWCAFLAFTKANCNSCTMYLVNKWAFTESLFRGSSSEFSPCLRLHFA